MILAFHSIFSAYGFWLPNEQRGSWSDFVASWDLLRYGPATKVDTRRSIAHKPYDRKLKTEMQSVLQYPAVRFTDEQIQVMGDALTNLPYTFHALAILHDHVHAVLGRTDRDIRRVVGHIKSEMTRALRAHGWFEAHSPWCDHGWNVYLDSPDDVVRSIDYTTKNLIREGMAPQEWSCVTPYVLIGQNKTRSASTPI